jgi:hypothetical protein
MNLNREVTKTDKLMAITVMVMFYVGVTVGVYLLPVYPLIGAILLGVGGLITLIWGLFSLNYLRHHAR